MRSGASTFTAFVFVGLGFCAFTRGWDSTGAWLVAVGIIIGLVRAW